MWQRFSWPVRSGVSLHWAIFPSLIKFQAPFLSGLALRCCMASYFCLRRYRGINNPFHPGIVSLERPCSMNRPILLFYFLLLNLLAYTQSNVLLLQKHGKTQKSFFPGHYISLQTKQGSFANGLITRITLDTIYIRHFDIEQTVTDFGGVYF